MSDYERNRGKLIPIELTEDKAREICADLNIQISDYYDNWIDCLLEERFYDYLRISNAFYKLEDYKREEEPQEWADITKNNDGSFSFDTYHYNGGGHWTELLEDKLV